MRLLLALASAVAVYAAACDAKYFLEHSLDGSTFVHAATLNVSARVGETTLPAHAPRCALHALTSRFPRVVITQDLEGGQQLRRPALSKDEESALKRLIAADG